MKDIIALNQELSSFGISLHKRTVEVLIGEIEQAITEGLIRSKDDQYSIFDFIRVLLGDKAERKTWKRFVETDSNTVAFCHSVKFDRKDGKLANTENHPLQAYLGWFISLTWQRVIIHSNCGDRPLCISLNLAKLKMLYRW
jgi:hypothetical protein